MDPASKAARVIADLITVEPGPPTSVEVTPSSATLAVQETAQFAAVVRDEFGNLVSGTPGWTILVEGGAIADNGLFTAGTVAGIYTDTVKATLQADAGELAATASVTVEPGPLSSAVLEPIEILLEIGAAQRFTFIALHEFGNEFSDFLSSWSALPEAGVIDANGLLTVGNRAGVFLDAIRVDVVKGTGRASATADVGIRPDPLDNIEVEPSFIVMEKGARHQFESTGFDQHGNKIPALAILWEATGGKISQTGLFTASEPSGSHEVKASVSRAATVLISFGPPSEGLVSWWPGEGNANDAVGGHHGALRGGATFAPGILGQAFNLDGVNDHVAVPDNDLWAFGTSNFTVELWAKFNSDPGGTLGHPGAVFIGNDEGGGTTRKWFFALGGRLLYFLINSETGGAFLSQVRFVPDLNQWYHLAVTRSADTHTIYVDGTAVSSQRNSIAILNAVAPLTIGQAEGFFMDGLIDEVRIYDRALSDEEVKAIYDDAVSSP